jgi:hypothetical protein
MVDIRINTGNLTHTQFFIPELGSEYLEGTQGTIVSLESGEYTFQMPLLAGLRANFKFQITPEGLIDYTPENNGFLQGRGTTTLTVVGFNIKLDGRSLSHDLMFHGGIETVILTRDRTHDLTLIPGTGYGFRATPNTIADFQFDLDVTGQIVLDPQYKRFASTDGRSLTINGYRITIDGQALSHDLRLYLIGNEEILSRHQTHPLTLIPTAGYTFWPTIRDLANFQFDLSLTGQIVLDPKYVDVARVQADVLVLKGYPITIDGRSLSYDLELNLIGNQEALSREQTHDLTLMPSANYSCLSSKMTVAIFDLDTAGILLLNPFYSNVAQVQNNQLILGKGVPGNTDLLIDTIQFPTTANPGESVRIQVVLRPDAPSDTQINVNNLNTHDVWLQAPGKIGDWKIPVFTASGKVIDQRTITVQLSGKPVAPMLQIANDPYVLLGIVLRVVDIDPDNCLLKTSDTYRWRIGQIERDTVEPLVAQDLTSEVNDRQMWTSLVIQCTITHSDGSTHQAKHTLVLGSTYRFLRDSLNQIRPPVSTDGIARQTGFLKPTYQGELKIRNIEPSRLQFTLQRIEWLVTEAEETTFAPDETIDVRMEPDTVTNLKIKFDRGQAPSGVWGAVVHLFGKTNDGLPVHTSTAFELLRYLPRELPDVPDLFEEPGFGETVINLWNRYGGNPFILHEMTGGLVSLPENIRWSGLTHHQVSTLQLLAEAVNDDLTLTAFGGELSAFAKSIQSQGMKWTVNRELIPEVLIGDAVFLRDDAGIQEGGDCDPDNLPDNIPDHFACQFTKEYQERALPGRIANARKGDIILSPGGNGQIGGLLAQLTPLQRYAHCGIMTKNFVEISHSTASEEWLVDHARGVDLLGDGKIQPTDGFDPAALRFQWPGGITQSVDGAYGGSEFTNPDKEVEKEVEEDDQQNPGQKKRVKKWVKKQYKLTAFNLADKAFLEHKWQLIEPLVLKPHPLAEHDNPILRKRLHQVADEVRKLCVTEKDTEKGQQSKVHYRLYCYTDAAIAIGPNAPAPPEAGWAAGTLPTVCSSLIWLTAHRLGLQLEGSGQITQPSELEPDDLAKAQIDALTQDGLYFYTEKERRDAAEWLVGYLQGKVATTALEQGRKKFGLLGEAFAALIVIIHDMASDCANQITNVFAFDWADTESKDSDRWQNPGVGRAVSPDDLMLWDKPEQGGRGLWGYSEPLRHYSGRVELVPVTKWRKSRGLGTLKGIVCYQDTLVPGATLNVGGNEAITGRDGQFSMTVLEGTYVLKASAKIDSIGWVSTTMSVDVKLNETTMVEVKLEPPPDQYRLVKINAFISFSDYESVGKNERDEDSKIWELDVNPWKTYNSQYYERGWGGECRVEATISAKLNFDRSVTVTLSADLFEGTSEDTNERGGRKSHTWPPIPKGQTIGSEKAVFMITNEEDDEPHTYAHFQLTITNTTQ